MARKTTANSANINPSANSASQSTDEDSKLLVTIATKIDEARARRFRGIAVACGMTDAQLFRLILHRADALFRDWDERINPRFFIERFELSNEKSSVFFDSRGGNSQLKR
jgi:hypothetical protein